MKANAIRHIQKQHEDVPQCDIEHYIHVNELAIVDGTQDNEHDDSMVNSSRDISSFSALASSLQIAAASAPPVAHLVPTTSGELLLTNGLPRSQHFSQPLDFTLNNAGMAARLSRLLSAQLKVEKTGEKQEDNQPIDLTTKKRTFSTSSSSSVASPAPDVTSLAAHDKQVHIIMQTWYKWTMPLYFNM